MTPVLVHVLLADVSNAENGMQDALMRLFYKDIPDDVLSGIRGDVEFENFCYGWKGITCTENRITSVMYHWCNGGTFNIYALPNSVRAIFMHSCEQFFAMRTRSLPRSLISISMFSNLIFGRPDLPMLPVHLELCRLSFNRMVGPIVLKNLPRNLRSLRLCNNRIVQDVVWYSSIPDSLTEINFGSDSGMQRVKSLRPINPSDAMKQSQKTIFSGVKVSKIH